MNSKLAVSIAVCIILLSSSLAYAEDGVDFFTWLWSLFGSQEPAVSVQGNSAQAGGTCNLQCGQDCNLEKCVNQDGCLWNKGNCDDICTPGLAKEIVVIKRYEGCSNAANCNDVYLCENSVTGYPVSAAFSTVPKVLDDTDISFIGSSIDDSFIFDDSTQYTDSGTVDDVGSGSAEAISCSNLPASFVAGYNQYSTIIKNAADNYLRLSVDNPEALIAAVITKESAWNTRAVNPDDPSYGLMQIVTSWHPECNEQKIMSFDAEENINCGVAYLSRELQRCGSIKSALKAYNSGRCDGRTTGDYAENILGEIQYSKPDYLDWKNCVDGATSQASPTASTADITYIGQQCTSPQGLAGTCQLATASGCTFDNTRSCGSSGTVKCCVPDSTFIGQMCQASNGARGTCQYVGTSGYTFPYTRLCPGTSAVKCGFPTNPVTGRVVTGINTDDISTDLSSLDASLAQQSSVLHEGQYTVSEKINIQSNGADFTYTDESGNTITPQCNIDPINTGARDYWIGLETAGDSCIGMHSVEQVATEGRIVDSNEIRNLFDNVVIGTSVTVKDPYIPELASISIIGFAELPDVRGQDYYDYYNNDETFVQDNDISQKIEDNPPLEAFQGSDSETVIFEDELMGIEASLTTSLTDMDDICIFEDNNMITADVVSSGCNAVNLRPQVVTAFRQMKNAAAEDGVTLSIVSGFRSFEKQRQIWNKKFDSYSGSESERVSEIVKFSAVPGLSRHHWGTELDLNSLDSKDFKTGGDYVNVYAWLKNNAARFGFCQPYNTNRSVVKTEEWHWSYKPLSSQFTRQHMMEVRAEDLSEQGIKGINVVLSNFDFYHRGFVSDINPNCLA